MEMEMEMEKEKGRKREGSGGAEGEGKELAHLRKVLSEVLSRHDELQARMDEKEESFSLHCDRYSTFNHLSSHQS